MERDLNNDEFEIFLKQKADQHKLYPSDKAWKGIYNSLHPGMKWFKIGGSLLVLSTLFIVYQETSYFNTSTSRLKSAANTNTNIVAGKNISITAKVPQEHTGIKGSSTLSSSSKQISKIEVITQGLSSNLVQHPTSAAATPVIPEDITSINSTVPASSARQSAIFSNNDLLNKPASFSASGSLKGVALRDISLLKLTSSVTVGIPVNHKETPAKQAPEAGAGDIAVADGMMKPLVSTVIGNSISNETEGSVKDINWLQEMAAIQLTAPKKSKFNLQFYFSPTVSYRRLVDNQNTSHSSIIGAPSVARDLNINRYVDHNPAIGAELGSNMLFSVTRSFTLKSGLQLNYSRYNIKAFKTFYEKASIALNNGGAVPDTISSYTSLRNFNGYASEDLQNQYLQVSVPLGAELKLIGNKRLQFSVAGTIQPTFLLFSDTYLLSNNYLNYTKEPSLVRKWNVHSSFEAFLSYKTGGFRWQLGPQFRYQLMSSFNDNYPIKEYLLEYGVKIGVSKTIR